MRKEEFQIRYKDSYVAFLDVLGFTNMVMRADEKKLNVYFNVVNKIIANLKLILEKQKIGYIVISDSIILTVTKSNNKREDINTLRQLCIAISKIQKELSLNNIWIRGAVTSGKTYFNEKSSQIVGPAYIKAYHLEETHAKYPRVILDGNIIDVLGMKNKSELIEVVNDPSSSFAIETQVHDVLYDWSKNSFASDIKIEEDVPLFIDYLSDILCDSKHSFMIAEYLRENLYLDAGVYSKYKWIVNYMYTVLLREENKNIETSKKVRVVLKSL